MVKNIVIVGAGIVGTCTAYYTALSQARGEDVAVTLIEGTECASAASGKAGGLLALDWHGAATASLSALSYKLHQQLAQEHGGEKWGYRQVNTLGVTLDASGSPSKKKVQSPLAWLPQDGSVKSHRSMGTPSTTSQVHPRLFTREILSLFLGQPRTSLLIATAVGLTLSASQSPTSLKVKLPSGETQDIPTDTLILTAGPWTGQVANDLFGMKLAKGLGVTGARAHSIVVKTKEPLSAHALFMAMTLKDGSAAEPEMYCRPDGTAYVCGPTDSEPLPPTAADVSTDPEAIATLHKETQAISPSTFSTAETIAEQSCYLPISPNHKPLVGKVRGMENVYIGAGHSCWGITQGPGTGKVLSELVLEGKVKSADISQLTPPIR